MASAIQNARSHARAESARTQASTAGRRLQEARALLMSLRTAREACDDDEVDRLLSCLEGVLGAVPEVARATARMPQQRLAVG